MRLIPRALRSTTTFGTQYNKEQLMANFYLLDSGTQTVGAGLKQAQTLNATTGRHVVGGGYDVGSSFGPGDHPILDVVFNGPLSTTAWRVTVSNPTASEVAFRVYAVETDA